jgi:hypothetical protein
VLVEQEGKEARSSTERSRQRQGDTIDTLSRAPGQAAQALA